MEITEAALVANVKDILSTVAKRKTIKNGNWYYYKGKVDALTGLLINCYGWDYAKVRNSFGNDYDTLLELTNTHTN